MRLILNIFNVMMLVNRLKDVLEHLWETPRSWAGETFKASEFNGKGDIDYFLRQFRDVATVNEWDEVSAILHMRSALKDAARECVKVDTLDGIHALTARFGLSVREAKA